MAVGARLALPLCVAGLTALGRKLHKQRLIVLDVVAMECILKQHSV